MLNKEEEKIIAKGLRPPGPLFMVKKQIAGIDSKRLRVIVSNKEAADELVRYFEERRAKAEIDMAGDDYHVIVDMTTYQRED